MGWLRRGRREPPTEEQEPEESAPPRVERAAPGVAALLGGLRETGGHAVLDMGPAVDENLRIYGRFARRVRFADLLKALPSGASWAVALRDVPQHPEQAYDLVLTWNLLDRMVPEQRHLLVERLLEITAPGARLYFAVDTSGERTTHPFRFRLLDEGRVLQEVVGAPHPAWPPILPAEMERLIEPFHVTQAFVLRIGVREYVAVRS